MTRKIIGIVGWKTSADSFGASLPYLNYFSNFGQVKVLTPDTEIDPTLDLVVLPGGADVDSNDYGEVPGFLNSSVDPYKSYFYKNNLPKYINEGIPVFGICLGMQQLNVFFNGKLVQHGGYKNSSHRGELVEELVLDNGLVEPYFNIMRKYGINTKAAIKINSMHHQGVTSTTISPELKVLAVSKEAQNVEAVIHPTLPIAGVQWHPEEIDDNLAFALITSLLNHKQ